MSRILKGVYLLLTVILTVEGRRGGGGGRISFGGSRNSFRGSSRGGPRYSGYNSYNSRPFTGNSYGYGSGYGRSRSSGGFGLGLGGGLALGYVAGRLSSPGYGYGYGYGHNYGQYNRNNRNFNRDRPISCYTGRLDTTEINGDKDMNETLTKCGMEKDVCFGQVTLSVVNKTHTNGTSSYKGYLEVKKGCGSRQQFEEEFKSVGTFDSSRQCFITTVKNTTENTGNNPGGSVEFPEALASYYLSTQTELCICEGTECNSALQNSVYKLYIIFIILINVFCMS